MKPAAFSKQRYAKLTLVAISVASHLIALAVCTSLPAQDAEVSKEQAHLTNESNESTAADVFTSGELIEDLIGSLDSLRKSVDHLSHELRIEPLEFSMEKADNVAFALEMINRRIGPLASFAENSGATDSDADESSAATSTKPRVVTYWEEVRRELPFEVSADKPKTALLRFHRHVINAFESAERMLECQRRARAAIDCYEGEWAVEHLEAALYLSWRGRLELRQARKQYVLSIQELSDWVSRFDNLLRNRRVEPEALFAKWQQGVGRDGLPDDYVAALASAGNLPHQITRLKQRLLSYDSVQSAEIYARFKSVVPELRREAKSLANLPDRSFVEDRMWTRLCFIWASLLKKYEQTEIAFELQELRGGADERYTGWCVLPAGASASELLRRSVMPTPKARSLLSVVTNKENDAEARSGPLVPAHYDVYLIIKKPERKQPLPVAVRVAKDVEVRLGQTAKVSVFDSQVRTLERLSFNSGVRIETSDGQSLPHKWFLVHHGADWTTTVGQSYEDAKDRMLVAPGKYDVYLAESNRPPLPFARAVTVKKNHWTVIEIGSALRLEVAKFLPSVNHHYGRWGVVRAGGNPNDMLHWSKSPGTLVLPPGEYDIYLKQDYWHKPLLLSANISVERGKLAKVRIDSGVKLEVAEGVPEFGYNGYWGVVPAGARFSTLLHWSKSPGALVLPLGTYDVYWKQSHSHKPLLLAADVRVDRGKISTVRIDSGVKLEVAEGVPEFGYNGYWGVVPAGARFSTLLHWSKSPGALVLPPGTYDVYWKQSSSHKPLLLAADVRVDRGKISTVRIDSGVKLEVAEGVPEFGYNGYWGVVPAGARPSPLLHWSKSPGALVLPLGTYDVYWKQSSSHKPLLLAADVRVDRGKISTVRIDSGVKLEVAEGVPEFGYNGYWGVVPAGARPSPLLHWSKSPGTLVLPLGTYDVYWKQSHSHKARLVESGVELERRTVKTIRVDDGP